jgi:hypothetical protein
MDMLWECPLCKARNAVGSRRCALCRNPYDKDETPPKAVLIREIPEWEEDSKVFDDLNARLERASVEIGKDSLPPKGAIRLVVPNNPLGWLTVAIVVAALAMTLAILKTMF